MTEQVIIAGSGGQGVMTMGQLLAYAGMIEEKQVSWLPSYGPEMRGGTANCNIIISEQPVGSPVVTEATAVIVMNKPSLHKFVDSVAPGGLLFINSSLIDTIVSRTDIKIYYIPANDLAAEIGSDKVVNIILLGAYIEKTGAVLPESIIESFKKVFGESKTHLIPVNQQALQKGAEFVHQK